MGLRDHLPGRLGGRPKPVLWAPEADTDDSWTPAGNFPRRQAKGPIQAPRRNADLTVLAGHENRAGHRLYVKVNQTRPIRKHTVGFGRWRRYVPRDYESQALLTAQAPLAPRAERRAEWAEIYRAGRKNRATRITPESSCPTIAAGRLDLS